MHEGQLEVSEQTVRALLADQLPAWAGSEVRMLPQSGTVNAIARIGDDLAALVTDLRAVPTEGRTFAGERRTGRGGVIGDHDPWVRVCLQRSTGLLDVAALTSHWDGFRTLARGPEPDVTAHGDLIPGNVLVTRSPTSDGREARLAGLLDVGGTGPADPALDLVAAWHLLDDGPRTAFRAALGLDDEAWARGAAWAFEQAIGLVWYYRTSHPAFSALGRRTLERIVRSPA